MVIGGVLQSKGCGFESRHRFMDGHFSNCFVVNIVMFVCLKRPKINETEGGMAHFKKTITDLSRQL